MFKKHRLLIGVDIVLIALLALQYRFLPEQIPLLYSRPWGEAQIVDYWYILLLPILMHVFYFTNQFLSFRFFHDDSLPSRVFSTATTIIILVFALIFIRILFLVT